MLHRFDSCMGTVYLPTLPKTNKMKSPQCYYVFTLQYLFVIGRTPPVTNTFMDALMTRDRGKVDTNPGIRPGSGNVCIIQKSKTAFLWFAGSRVVVV